MFHQEDAGVVLWCVGYARDVITITSSYATGDVSGRDGVGGLVGQLYTYGQTSTITNSHATGDVSGSSWVGGLVGAIGVSREYNFHITNSYTTGDVSGGRSVGGLVGSAQHSTITRSYAAGDVSGGGLVGGTRSTTITSSYAKGNSNDSLVSSGHSTIINSAIKTEIELKAGTPTDADDDDPIYVDWSYDIWDFGTSNTYPILD